MANRLFLASYEDIQDWGSRADRLLKTIESDDKIFLIMGKEPLNSAKEKMIQKLKEVAHVRITDTEGQNSGIIGKALLTEFLKKEESGVYTVYIIGASLQCIYDDRDEFESYAESVFYNHNFQVKKLKQKEGEDESMQLFMDAMMGSDEGSVAPKAREEAPQPKKNSSLKAEKERREKKENPRKRRTVSIETQRSSVEREIFGAAFESKSYEESYTDLQNARAKYIFELQERTNNHIRQKLFQKKETITLTQDELYDFITLMMSSDNAEMFSESWSSQHNVKIDMTEETFNDMRPEIAFFNHICELVYDFDFWED